MKSIKYVLLSVLAFGAVSCENDVLEDLRDRNNGEEVVLPDLTAGSADFSKFVSVGASFTAGFTDNALFKASQMRSFPKIMNDQFVKIGGGEFTQPMMNDNVGGLLAGGNVILDPMTGENRFKPRLVFGGAGPVQIESLNPLAMTTTDIALNNPTGPFTNMGVPGAKSFHLLANGYGNLNNLPLGLANPYAIRMTGSTPDASTIELAVAQNPTFVTISEVGGNDVLGYALKGGDGLDPITPTATFDASVTAIVNALTAGGAKGAIGNVPDITSLAHFTTVPHNPLDPSNPDFGPLIPTLNTVFGALNDVYAFLQFQGAITDAAERTVVFSTSEANAVVIVDENLPNISTLITQTLLGNPAFPAFLAQFGLPAEAAPQVAGLFGLVYGQARQATSNELFVLPSSGVIGNVNETFAGFLVSQGLPPALAGQFAAEGVTLPLEDKWVLLPEEQQEIAMATSAYNATIASLASANDLALVDLNGILEEASTSGVQFDEFNHNTDLVFGGLISLDGVHLTSRGYALMANAFLDAIDATYGSNFRASGNVAKAVDYPTNYSATMIE